MDANDPILGGIAACIVLFVVIGLPLLKELFNDWEAWAARRKAEKVAWAARHKVAKEAWRKAGKQARAARHKAVKEAWESVRFGGSLSAILAAFLGIDEAQREGDRKVMREQNERESVLAKEAQQARQEQVPKARRAAIWTWWKTLRLGGSFLAAATAAKEAREKVMRDEGCPENNDVD